MEPPTVPILMQLWLHQPLLSHGQSQVGKALLLLQMLEMLIPSLPLQLQIPQCHCLLR
jgi:hypothetical protein